MSLSNVETSVIQCEQIMFELYYLLLDKPLLDLGGVSLKDNQPSVSSPHLGFIMVELILLPVISVVATVAAVAVYDYE